MRKGYSRTMLSAATLAVSLAMAGEAAAQAVSTGSTAAAADDASETKATAPSTGSDGMQDIVVTAQRQSQSLQKVPISITAVSAAAIENLNIRNIDKIATVTPGLIYDTGYSFVQVFVRGVGDQTPGVGLETPVATYVDGAYLARGTGTIFDLVDLASVEVLKGPQGTLYGRNATGGAILIRTADPTDDFELKGMVELGRFGHSQIDGVLNVPLGDQAAVRFAGRYRNDGGFLDNITTGDKVRGKETYDARVKLRVEPSDDFSAVLGFDYHRENGNANAAGRNDSRPPFCPACVTAQPVYTGFYQTADDFRRHDKGRSYNLNVALQYDIGAITLKSLTAYRDLESGITQDVDGTAAKLFVFDAIYGGKTFQQDLQVGSNFGGAFDFLAGVSYIHDDAFQRSLLYGTLFGLPYDGVNRPAQRSEGRQFQITKSYSAFAELYVRPIDRLTLTLGGRYTKDKRDLDTYNNQLAVNFNNPGGPLQFEQKASYQKFTPRIVVAYDADELNLYASYTQGFRAGGFNTPSYAPRDPTDPIRPETMTSYEVGAKYVSPDRRTRASLALFRYDYDDVIVSILNGPTRVVRNSPSARGKGVELDVTHRFSDWLTVSTGGQYLDAKYRRYTNGATYDYRRNAAGAITGIVLVTRDLSGVSLPRAPKWTGYVSANIEAPISADWIMKLNGVARYTSEYDFVVARSGVFGADYQKKLTLVNVSGGIGPSSGAYEIGFYVDNLTDRKYYSNRITGTQGIVSLQAMPRTYGLRLKFGY